jgi:hypothetical protein
VFELNFLVLVWLLLKQLLDFFVFSLFAGNLLERQRICFWDSCSSAAEAFISVLLGVFSLMFVVVSLVVLVVLGVFLVLMFVMVVMVNVAPWSIVANGVLMGDGVPMMLFVCGGFLLVSIGLVFLLMFVVSVALVGDFLLVSVGILVCGFVFLSPDGVLILVLCDVVVVVDVVVAACTEFFSTSAQFSTNSTLVSFSIKIQYNFGFFSFCTTLLEFTGPTCALQ